MRICSYLLLICIYMECFGFKLEFGHLVPEFDTDRQKMETRDTKMDGKRSEALYYLKKSPDT